MVTRELPVLMPKMSMTMQEGTLVVWHKRPGDAVRAGDTICDVATDKVDMEVESPADGTLTRIVADEDDVVPVGQPIAYLTSSADDLLGGLLDDPTDGGTDAPQPAVAESMGLEPAVAASIGPEPAAAASVGPDPAGPECAASDSAGLDPADSRLAAIESNSPYESDQKPSGGSVPETVAAGAAPRSGDGGASGGVARNGVTLGGAGRGGRRPAAVPLAWRWAAASGVDLTTVRGTGPGGVIRAVDVERIVSAGSGRDRRAGSDDGGGRTRRRHATRATDRRAAVRAGTARRLSESTRVPQFTVHADVDLSEAAAGCPTGTWTAHLVRAWAAVLRASSALNAIWRDDRVQPFPQVGVAVGVDTPAGLLTPVVRDPDLMPVGALEALIAQLASQARAGRLAVAHLSGAAGTLIDLGDGDTLVSQAQVPVAPPHATTLVAGSRSRQPVVTPQGVGVRTRCRVGLTVDQRVADPHDAARALAALRDLLTEMIDVREPR